MISYTSILLALVGTVGFCILFQVPQKSMVFSALCGALGWAVYILCQNYDITIGIAAFSAAAVVAIAGEILARTRKEAVTIFVIPGILPLVPGMGIYYCMFNFLSGNEAKAAYWGEQTLIIAGAIALGILVVSSLVRSGSKIISSRRRAKN